MFYQKCDCGHLITLFLLLLKLKAAQKIVALNKKPLSISIIVISLLRKIYKHSEVKPQKILTGPKLMNRDYNSSKRKSCKSPKSKGIQKGAGYDLSTSWYQLEQFSCSVPMPL